MLITKPVSMPELRFLVQMQKICLVNGNTKLDLAKASKLETISGCLDTCLAEFVKLTI